MGFYHCVSRVVDRRKIFRTLEKERFVSLMREYESFCEVRVLTYAVMSNHFHILLQVPPRPAVLPTPEELLLKLSRLSGHVDLDLVQLRIQTYRDTHDEAGLNDYLETFFRRMWDVSAFMKQVKQRFTQWYNALHGRKGALWEERFRSVLVEGMGMALAAVAAYIDLNPVRAGITQDPMSYRWCGYAEAVAGRRRAMDSLQIVVAALLHGHAVSRSEAMSTYSALLDVKNRAKSSLGREDSIKLLEEKGRLILRDYLRCRVRYFTDGLALGSRGFVEEIFREYRSHFGSRRRQGSKPLRGLAQHDLSCLRDLRRRVFG
ncbi:MAG: hypothetical protein RI897_1633 [Verrucomicrobiota bacterium]|jgi:REP element-mobilizing transposase RayT